MVRCPRCGTEMEKGNYSHELYTQSWNNMSILTRREWRCKQCSGIFIEKVKTEVNIP